jgi:ABC-2 type transport system permease protein
VTTLTLAARDSTTMLGRELKHTLRYPLILISAILSPIVMLLLFAYVLGGPIGNGLGGGPYLNFLVPGVIMMTAAAGASPTAINVCTDMSGGIVDRFRAMAVGRGSLLSGHVLASALRTVLTTAIVTGIAFVVGFRPQASIVDWLAALGLVIAFAFALGWVAAALGLGAKTIAGANSASLPIQFLLPFLSSAFVPAESMPAGLRWFSEHQPFTPVTESLRALLTGAPVRNSATIALLWCAGIAVVGYLWALAAFKRRTR